MKRKVCFTNSVEIETEMVAWYIMQRIMHRWLKWHLTAEIIKKIYSSIVIVIE